MAQIFQKQKPMKKAYEIGEVKFTKKHLVIAINNREHKFKLSDISKKLEKASDLERNDFRLSPSGYGIHWRSLDEDLSINGLLGTYK